MRDSLSGGGWEQWVEGLPLQGHIGEEPGSPSAHSPGHTYSYRGPPETLWALGC